MTEFLLGIVAVSTGIVAGIVLLYLLYADIFVVGYPRFFRIIALGMFVFAGSGILIGLFMPAGIHGVHAVSSLVVALGLYDLLTGELQPDDSFWEPDVAENAGTSFENAFEDVGSDSND